MINRLLALCFVIFSVHLPLFQDQATKGSDLIVNR